VTAAAVRGYFDGRVELILDGGPTAGGAGSTVADCTVWPPRILRQGPVVLEPPCG
jgi:L-threonylcarbamoyladenylate synthase